MKPSDELRLAKINAKLSVTKEKIQEQFSNILTEEQLEKEVTIRQNALASNIKYARHQGERQRARNLKKFYKTEEGKKALEDKWK